MKPIRFLSFLLLFCLCMSNIIISYADGYDLDNSYLSDINFHWAEGYILDLYDMDILNGYDNKSNPDDLITRAEFIAMLTRSIYNLDTYTPTVYFNDVLSSDIFIKNVSIAKENGIIKGTPAGLFDRNKPITREEIILIVSRLLNKYGSYETIKFTDIKNNYIYKSELDKVISLGIINGYNNNTFRPYSNATRAETASIILRVLKCYGESESDSSIINFTDNYILSDSKQPNSIGTQFDDVIYKDKVNSTIKSLGGIINKQIRDLKTNIIENNGCTATVQSEYYTDYETYYQGKTTNVTRHVKNDIKLFRKDGVWKVFSSNESFIYDKKINLTWEVYTTTPSYIMDGVNIISPDWFILDGVGGYPYSPQVYNKNGKTITMSDNAKQSYIDYAHANGYKLWPMYKTDFDLNTANKFLNDTSAREKAINTLILNVLKYRLDGINFDFEHMYEKDRDAYTNHVREVSAAMREMGLMMSIDVTPYDSTSSEWSLCFDRDALAKYTDYIFLMAYDQNGTWSEKGGPVAGLDWVESNIKTLLKEVKSEKIVLGVPFYNRLWQEKNGKVVSTKAISMTNANALIAENNASLNYSTAEGQNIATWTLGDSTYKIWLENADSISKKAALSNKYNLSGIGSWRRGFETVDVWGKISQNLK